MECHRVQDAILESLIEPQPDAVQAAIDAHVAGCPACASFARAQRDLDRQLSAYLRPPLPLGFRAAVRRRVRQESRSFWPDLLPDALHLAGCAIVTLLGLVWLPLSATVVLAAGATGTLLTHVALTALHDTLDAAEDLAS